MCDYMMAVVVSQPSGSRAGAVVDVFWTKTSFGVLFPLMADYKSAEGSHWNKVNLNGDGGGVEEEEEEEEGKEGEEGNENLYEVGDEAEVFTNSLVLGLQTNRGDLC